MAGKVVWNKYEAVILLDGYIESLRCELPKLRIIKRISAELRQMAIHGGQEIDEVFRNENGISFQMQSMKSAYLGYTVDKKPATQLFADVVSLYKTNHPEYDKLLEEAKNMINEEQNNGDVFSSWLVLQKPPMQLSGLLWIFEEIEHFCLKLKVLHAPLLNTTDVETLAKVKKTIESNKFFTISHRKQMNKIVSAMKLYYEFVRSGAYQQEKSAEQIVQATEASATIEENGIESSTDSKQTIPKTVSETIIRTEQDKRLLSKYPIIYKRVLTALQEMSSESQYGVTVVALYEYIKHIARCADIEDVLDNVSWAKCENKKYIFSNEIVSHDDTIKGHDVSVPTNLAVQDTARFTVDFINSGDYAFTTPVKLCYFDTTKVGFQSWTELYVSFFALLYEDYPNIFNPTMSFSKSGNGRIELCEHASRSIMVAPKQVPGTSLFLETNISATNMVDKMRYMLDLCQVDYDNVVIEYCMKNGSPITTTSAMHHSTANQNVGGRFDSKAFYAYLHDNEGMVDATCRSYVSAVGGAERFAAEHHFESCRLFTPDWCEAKATSDALFTDSIFIKYNEQQHNRFRAAIKKLLFYLRGDTATVAPNQAQISTDKSYKNVLVEYFKKGFRLGSPIELRKFRRCYEQLNEKALEADDAEIERNIRICGIQFDEKVFIPQTMLSGDLKERLLSYISDRFAEDKITIYYQAIFNEFSEEFLDSYIYNTDMLKAYLTFMSDGKFYIERSYLSKDANVTADPLSEIRTCLSDYAAPMNYDDIFETLSHIPGQKIKTILATNDEFISNGRGEYFHISAVHFSDEELDNIADIINDAINDKEFLSGNELIDAVMAKYPYTYEKNVAFSIIGLRDAVKYHLCSKFSFFGNIISRHDSSLTMSDVFSDYCRSRDEFTISELNTLASELATVIYFNEVYDNSLRISQEQFVSRARVRFQVKETDDVIDRFCTGNYVSIGKINVFGAFPDADFPWNSFLLEHYVSAFSERYNLLHTGFNAIKCVGAIVKSNSDIKDFDDFIATALADSNIQLTKTSALQYLCDEGYIARRVYNNIEELLIKATAQRNQREVN